MELGHAGRLICTIRKDEFDHLHIIGHDDSLERELTRLLAEDELPGRLKAPGEVWRG